MTIGEKIKQLRKNKKLTQKALAKESGIAEITIRQYEAGMYSPKMEQLKKLCQALQVPIGELLTDGQLDMRRLDVANRGLQSILESVYDTVDFDWHKTVDSDGVPEYDGDFTVTLSKQGQHDIQLTKKDWEALFLLVCGSIPGHIKLIEDRS